MDVKITDKAKFGNMFLLTLETNVAGVCGENRHVMVNGIVYEWHKATNLPKSIGIRTDNVCSDTVEFIP